MQNLSLFNQQILKEIRSSLEQVDSKDIDNLIEALINAKRIFLAGAGRSLLMVKCFGMRLMHLGFTVYIVGEVTTPAIIPGDLLVIASGSGETGSMINIAKKAQDLSIKIILITTKLHSTIASLVKHSVIIPISCLENDSKMNISSVQPGASLFEQCLLIVFDSIILSYINDQKRDHTGIMLLHANLE